MMTLSVLAVVLVVVLVLLLMLFLVLLPGAPTCPPTRTPPLAPAPRTRTRPSAACPTNAPRWHAMPTLIVADEAWQAERALFGGLLPSLPAWCEAGGPPLFC